MDLKNLGRKMLFREMTEAEITDCLAALNACEKEFQKGSVIMRAGEQNDWMGMILSGSVTIESNDVWGNCTILSHVGTGQFFAETYALLPGQVMLVDVRANENCRVLFLYLGNPLRNLPSVAWKEKLLENLLIISSHKNLALSGRSFHISQKSCRGRLLSYLNAVSLQTHAIEFDIPFDRQQLADYLNLERTNMSKELSRMQKEGVIEFKKNHFKLIKIPESLQI